MVGALIGGACFIVPGLSHPGPGGAVSRRLTARLGRGRRSGRGRGGAAVAAHAGWTLVPDSRKRTPSTTRWTIYVAAGAVSAATVGPWLVFVLIGSGIVEVTLRHRSDPTGAGAVVPFLLAASVSTSTLLSLAWVAIKVGALSYGGGFVIIPLMQADAVNRYHWMTSGQFLNAVAFGQLTPGPVVQTVAVVGYAAAGVGGGLFAALVAFSPSFAFILIGGSRFDRLRANPNAKAFLNGAGPAAIGAILGTAIPLAGALTETWQYGVLAGAAALLFIIRGGVVLTPRPRRDSGGRDRAPRWATPGLATEP
jgi:chromate transporter